jgi:hypothetical protein
MKNDKISSVHWLFSVFWYHIAFIDTTLPPSKYLHILQAFQVKANSTRNMSKKKKEKRFVTYRINYKFPFTVWEHQVVKIFAV